MPVPNVSYKVEIAFTSNWLTPAAGRTWTDVSSYVEFDKGMSITYGRSDELATADANTLTLTLDNKDGRFTWGNASSPYSPNVKIGKPIRVTATVGGVDYVRFVGYINEWPVEWPGDSASFALTTISASSRLSRLGLSAAASSAIDAATLALGPRYYWPLADALDSRVAVEANGTGADLSASPIGVTFGVGADAEDDSTEYLAIDGRSGVKLTSRTPMASDGILSGILPTALPVSSSAGVSMSLFIKVLNPTSWVGDFPFFEFRSSSSGLTQRLYATLHGGFATMSAGSGFRSFGINLENDGSLHHLALTLTADGSTRPVISAYLDGVLVGTTTGTAGSAMSLSEVRLFAATDGIELRNLLVGRLGIWDRVLTAPEVATLAQSGFTAFRGDTTDARLRRYAAWARIPSAEVLTTASPVILAGIPAGEAKVEALMRQVETDEAGALYDDRNGNLVLAPRAARYKTTPALTIAFTSDRINGYVPKVDRQGLANLGKGQGADGVESIYVDQASRDEYGDAEYSAKTENASSSAAYELVSWQVNANDQPRPRVPAPKLSVIDWIGTPELAALLGLDIGSKLRLTDAPSQAPGATTADYFVEGYSEEMSPGAWSISPNLSSSAAYDAVLILDDPTLGTTDAANVLAL